MAIISNNFVAGDLWRIASFGVPCLRQINTSKTEHFMDIFGMAKEEKEEETVDLEIVGNTLIFRIEGILIPKTDWFDECMGMVSTFKLRESFEERLAVAPDDIKRIILYIDSPGGQAIGIKEFAEYIHEIAKDIDIITFSDISLCSAAYHIASATNGIYTTKTALVGSIGTKIVVIKQQPYNFDVINFSKGDLKNAGDSHTQLNTKEMKHFIEWIEKDYDDFVGDVAKWRNKPVKEVIATESAYTQASYNEWFVDGLVSSITDLII